MEVEISLDYAYLPSNDIVARDIEGELIIGRPSPLASAIWRMTINALNYTGKAIWEISWMESRA